MRAIDATVLCLLGFPLLGCERAPRAGTRPADAGTVVTVYVPAASAERLMGRLQTVAARRQWVLSIRTDSAALAEADLAIVDSGGRLVARVRSGSPAADQARQMGEAALP
jgi:hypothetical protein